MSYRCSWQPACQPDPALLLETIPSPSPPSPEQNQHRKTLRGPRHGAELFTRRRKGQCCTQACKTSQQFPLKKIFDLSPKFFSKWRLLCSLFPSLIVLPAGWSLKASIILPIPFESKLIDSLKNNSSTLFLLKSPPRGLAPQSKIAYQSVFSKSAPTKTSFTKSST